MAGRPRKHDLDLPPRVRHRRGTYFFIEPSSNRWINLGKDKAAAIQTVQRKEAQLLDMSGVPLTGADASAIARYALQIHRDVRARARQKGMQFELTEQDVLELLVESDGHCALSGLAFSWEPVGKRSLRPWAPSVDRKNAADGYRKDNVRLVCLAVNIALSDFGDEVLIRMATAIADRSISSSGRK